MAIQEIVLMKTLNYFIKDENNTVLGDSHSSILLPYASPEHCIVFIFNKIVKGFH